MLLTSILLGLWILSILGKPREIRCNATEDRADNYEGLTFRASDTDHARWREVIRTITLSTEVLLQVSTSTSLNLYLEASQRYGR